MKMILISLLACFTLACEAKTSVSKTEIKTPKVEVVAPKSEDVKSNTKKVCIKVYDAKLKKEVEKCRTIKTHKKYEGTAVPERKKK